MSPIFFSSTGGNFTKRSQTGLTGHADGDLIPLDGVARQEFFECLSGEGIGIGVGLRQDFGMFNIIEGGRRYFIVNELQSNGFEGALTNINTPNAGL